MGGPEGVVDIDRGSARLRQRRRELGLVLLLRLVEAQVLEQQHATRRGHGPGDAIAR